MRMEEPARRVVTAHDPSGRSFPVQRGFPVATVPSAAAALALVWTTASVPRDNDDETGGRKREPG
jgi:hypothetical protein